jgi:heptaprenyl diphosphate synthase
MTTIEEIRINHRITILSLIVALGVVLHRLEILIPLPSPWIKLGLANVMTLVTLIFFGLRDALTVTLLRIMLGSIIGGTFLSPTFFWACLEE